jgi:hypothetical protein
MAIAPQVLSPCGHSDAQPAVTAARMPRARYTLDRWRAGRARPMGRHGRAGERSPSSDDGALLHHRHSLKPASKRSPDPECPGGFQHQGL